MRKWDDCNGCGGVGVNTISCTSCNGSGKRTELPSCAQTLLVNRDLHELYKEGAEKWAKEQVEYYNEPFASGPSFEGWNCESCERGHHSDASNAHAADCKAARILDLPREGA